MPLAATAGTRTHTCHLIATASLASVSTVSTKWEAGDRPGQGGPPTSAAPTCPFLSAPTPHPSLPSSMLSAANNNIQGHAIWGGLWGTPPLTRPLSKEWWGEEATGGQCPTPTPQSPKAYPPSLPLPYILGWRSPLPAPPHSSRPLLKLDEGNPVPSPSGQRWSKPAASRGPARRRRATARTRGSARSGCGRTLPSPAPGHGAAAVAEPAVPSCQRAEETPARESPGARRDGRVRRP